MCNHNIRIYNKLKLIICSNEILTFAKQVLSGLLWLKWQSLNVYKMHNVLASKTNFQPLTLYWPQCACSLWLSEVVWVFLVSIFVRLLRIVGISYYLYFVMYSTSNNLCNNGLNVFLYDLWLVTMWLVFNFIVQWINCIRGYFHTWKRRGFYQPKRCSC